jgi:epoxyqueuosine reductase QueG
VSNTAREAIGLRQELFAEAHRLGFSSVGIAGVRPFRLARERGLRAIAEGRMSGMPWYTAERVEAATDLGARYPWAESMLALAWPYRPAGDASMATPGADPGRPRGRFSAYACIDVGAGAVDYHQLLAEGCDALVAWLREHVPELRAKRFVDHGWAMDRAVA